MPRTGIKKPGSGRTKGAVSIVSVTMKDLMRVFSDPKTRINVSRKFIEQFPITYQFIEGQTPPAPVGEEPTKVTKNGHDAPKSGEKIAIKTHKFG